MPHVKGTVPFNVLVMPGTWHVGAGNIDKTLLKDERVDICVPADWFESLLAWFGIRPILKPIVILYTKEEAVQEILEGGK